MLNISNNSADHLINVRETTSYKTIMKANSSKVFARWLTGLFIVLIAMMFLPWTQNIRANGKVNALLPEQRPQTLQAAIPGRIEKWFVKEGQLVKKGDTIVFLSEIKDEYFDPDLIKRTQMQVKSKEAAVSSYVSKSVALDKQIKALTTSLRLKMEQARNKVKQSILKVQSDSLDLQASKTDFEIAQKQYDRQKKMYEQGLTPLTNLERLEVKLRDSKAKLIGSENKWLTSKNEYINALIEINSIENDYADKISKAQSERFSTLAGQYDAEATVTKMTSDYTKYSIRSGFYYITAPQDCYITRVNYTGLGETVKAGDEILTIMPSKYQLAVELYIDPIDLPLVKVGEKTRFIFDGWPALVFSGWPALSYGTFGGEVVAIDNVADKIGKYRILISESTNETKWPEAIRPGSGAKGILLLKNVPLWYELWRQLNGFPPEYYDKKLEGQEKMEYKKEKE